MLREKRDDNILTNRKNSNWSRISKKNIEKQNLMLPVLSITQLKLGQKFGANKTLARPLPTSKIIHDARLRSSLSKRSETDFRFSRAKTPSQNDSFSTDQNQKTEQLKNRYKKKLLPPLNANTDKYSMSNMTTPPKSLKSQQVQAQAQAKSTKQKQRKLRLKTDCKIILQKNNLFPFYNRNGGKSKSKTVDRRQRQGKKQERQENVENNAQAQDEEIFKFQQSAISQIGIKQDPAQFISKDSFKEILDI